MPTVHAQQSMLRFWRHVAFILFVLPLCLLLLLVLAVTLYSRFYLKEFIADRLTRTVIAASDSLYTLQASRFTFDIDGDTIQAQDVSLVPIRSEKNPNVAYHDIYVESITILRPHWREILTQRLFRVEQIVITAPYFVYRSYESHEQRDSITAVLAQDLPEPTLLDRAIDAFLPRFQIDRIEITDAEIGYEGVALEEQNTLTLSMQADTIRLNLKAPSFNEAVSIEDIRLLITPYRNPIPNSLYDVRFAQMRLSTRDSSLVIDSLWLTPRVSDTEFFKRSKTRTDRFKLFLPHLACHGIDYRSLIFGTGALARHLHIEGLSLDVLTDKRYPLPKHTFTPKMPNEAFRSLPLPIRIDTLTVQNGRVSYRVQNPADKPCALSFERIAATATNLTNDSLKMTPHTPAILDATAWLLGTGAIYAHLEMPLLSETFDMRLHGRLGKFDVTALNAFTASEARVSFSSGTVEKVWFNLSVKNGYASGTVHALYRNLALNILPQNRREKAGFMEGVLSFIANTFVIYRDNTHRKDTPARTGKISLKRKPKQPFFDFLWQSLWQGLQHIMKAVK